MRNPSGQNLTHRSTQRLLRDIAATAVKAWESGDRAVIPFWRVVDPETPTARLMAGGAAFIRARRAEEAFES
jgi:hypothetical protein